MLTCSTSTNGAIVGLCAVPHSCNRNVMTTHTVAGTVASSSAVLVVCVCIMLLQVRYKHVAQGRHLPTSFTFV